jgi:hypothetical protein
MRPISPLLRNIIVGLSFGFLTTVALRAAEPALTVSYAGKTIAYLDADLAGLAHQQVKAFDFHEKMDHVYSGVPVRDLLQKDGVPFGDEKLRGKNLRLVVLVHCRDHYDIAFALAEFDDAFNSRTILLVDGEDGHPLPGGQGPLRLVVPGDKRPARWARMVVSLEVVSVGDIPGA